MNTQRCDESYVFTVIIEPDNVSTARERLQGYSDALKEAGITPAPELVIRTTADRGGGYGAMQQILGMSFDGLISAGSCTNRVGE